MGKTKGRVAASVAGEVSGVETITVVTASAVDFTVREGGSAVITTVVSDLDVAISTNAGSVTVGSGGRATVLWEGEAGEVAVEVVGDGVN